MQHASTQDLLIVQRYSKLLDKAMLENEVLREELIKSKTLQELHYNSRCRWQTKYENLLREMSNLIENRRN